jgi:lipoprotein-anchoring transpeptidase ErfK/SrfK
MGQKRIKKYDHSLRWTIIIFGSFLLFLIGLVLHFKSQESVCANSISCINDLSGKKEITNEGVFMGKKVIAPELTEKPQYALKDLKSVLGDTTDKHIYVDLTNQKLYAYEGSTKVYDFLVSTGKWGPTPTGDFRIWTWLRYTRMAGGNQALGTYYNLPNVPYTMYFANAQVPRSAGYSLHGTYWHNNFGHPMSHGCVNMRIEDAAKIFYWSNSNTIITIYGTAPAS